MRKLMLALTLGLGLSVSAQEAISTSFSTSMMESASMNWSESQQDWIFEDSNDLTEYSAFWTFDLGEEGKGGYITSGGGEIIYSVYDWEFTDNGILANFYSHSLKEHGTLIIVVRPDNRNTMSFFLPGSHRNIVFHQSIVE